MLRLLRLRLLLLRLLLLQRLLRLLRLHTMTTDVISLPCHLLAGELVFALHRELDALLNDEETKVRDQGGGERREDEAIIQHCSCRCRCRRQCSITVASLFHHCSITAAPL